MVTRLQDGVSWVWIPQGAKIFSSSKCPDWPWGPASLLFKRNWGSFQGTKVARAWCRPITFCMMHVLWTNYLEFLLFNCIPFYIAQLKYASVDVHLVLFIINYTLYHRMTQYHDKATCWITHDWFPAASRYYLFQSIQPGYRAYPGSLISQGLMGQSLWIQQPQHEDVHSLPSNNKAKNMCSYTSIPYKPSWNGA